MEFISVNFSLNQIYQVEKSVFEEIAKKAIKKVKGITFESAEASLSKNHDDVSIIVTIKKEAKTNYDVVIPKAIEEVESLVFNLLDGKPKNIKIKFKK